MVPVATCGTPVLPVRSRAAVVRAVARDTSRPRSHSVPFSSDDSHLEEWSPQSWKKYEAKQQPNYPDQGVLKESCNQIAAMPPLVFAGESRIMQENIAKAARGDSFLLFGGDCAEAFSQFSANHIRDLYRVILQMAVVLMYSGGIPIVKIGRVAGQFAKPRSADMEKKGDEELPSYRGDIINGPEFTAEARIPDPKRLVQAYHQSAATLNLLRGFSSGGYGGLDRVTDWNLDFMASAEQGAEYLKLAEKVEEAVDFLRAATGVSNSPLMNETDFFTAHECLLLDYESALTREDSTTGLYYNCSAHFVWCGERTRELDGAHMEFLRGCANPIGVKVSDKMAPEEMVEMVRMLNPNNVPGRITIITRMGAEKMRSHLPTLIQAIQDQDLNVTWVTDPMHGNTESVGEFKTRRFDNIKAEVEAFFDVHEQMGTVPGGIHLEMTGENVTECIGGGSSVTPDDLGSRYHTHCDPRLNACQSLELAFFVGSRLKAIKNVRKAAKKSGMKKAAGGATAKH